MPTQRTVAPIQLYYLFKSVVIMFTIQAVIVLFMPAALTAPIRYQILALNVGVSITLGWFLYKQWYHTILSYNDLEFELRKGKAVSLAHMWKEFSAVSLARDYRGDFSVRLYRGDDRVELPASKLKLDPFRFRDEVLGLVAKPGG